MSTLNDLTDYNTPLQPNATEIRTEYLEPITSSTYKYTFRLDQSGYLDTNSMLVFKLLATAKNNELRANCWNGVLGGIKRVIFQVGDNVINDVQDVYKYATMKNMNMPTSMRNDYLGHYLGNSFWTDILEDATQKADKDDTSVTMETYKSEYANATVGSVLPNYKKSGVDFGKTTATIGDNATINSMPIGTNKATNHQYGITLGMLIPALKGQKIPLFLFDKQRILLTFEFNTSEVYVNSINANDILYDAGGTGWASSGDVIPTEVKMVVDYIVVPTDAQNELMAQTMADGGYRLEFYDVVNVEKNISADVQEVEHRIGQNNREVHNILMWKESPSNQMSAITGGATKHKGEAYFGKYQKCQGFAIEEYNCNIDGRDEFDHFVFNPVSQYNELSAVLGKDYEVVRPQYCCDSNTAHSFLTPIESGLLGTQKPLGLSLRNGEPLVVGGGRAIGNYPIIWKWKRTGTADADVAKNLVQDNYGVKVNYFAEVSRVANIMNTGKGMNVIVSY